MSVIYYRRTWRLGTSINTHFNGYILMMNSLENEPKRTNSDYPDINEFI